MIQYINVEGTMGIVIYCLITFIATLLGAIAGLGGGVIIKPMFDMLGLHSASEIGFYSTCCVFAMCLVSIIKQFRGEIKINFKFAAVLSIGSIIGGFIGDAIFSYLAGFVDDHLVKLIQAAMLLLILVVIYIYTRYQNKLKSYTFTSNIIVFSVGLLLGTISVFLGIGGGPLNIALLALLFSFDIKTCVIYSIITIFFSQLSKLGTIVISQSYLNYEVQTMLFLIPFAIIGGYIGSLLNQKLSSEKVMKTYEWILILLMIISIYNVLSNILI